MVFGGVTIMHPKCADSTFNFSWPLRDHSNELFINPRVDDMYEQYWEYTFPKLTPIVQSEEKKKFQKIILAPGLFNLNSLESLATAMEISSISAHNGARLVLDYLMSL